IRDQFRPKLVIASPYKRAHDTGLIIASELGIPLEIEEAIREQSLGQLAGQSYDVVLKDPTFDPDRSWLWRPPGGESHEDVLKRVAPALDRIARIYAHAEVVVVSHGGVMRSLWAHVTGKWEGAHIPANCGIVLIEHEQGSYKHPRVVTGERWDAPETGG
ncbi:MAG TPA: histidine phosphatase family protein, partial [Candidatus Binataceae bacterium]